MEEEVNGNNNGSTVELDNEITPIALELDFGKRSRIGNLLLNLAKENGYLREDNLFIDRYGRKYIAVNRGFITIESHNAAKTIGQLEADNSILKGKIDAITQTNTILQLAVKNQKNVLKIANIVTSNMSNEEKVKAIRKYLNV